MAKQTKSAQVTALLTGMMDRIDPTRLPGLITETNAALNDIDQSKVPQVIAMVERIGDRVDPAKVPDLIVQLGKALMQVDRPGAPAPARTAAPSSAKATRKTTAAKAAAKTVKATAADPAAKTVKTTAAKPAAKAAPKATTAAPPVKAKGKVGRPRKVQPGTIAAAPAAKKQKPEKAAARPVPAVLRFVSVDLEGRHLVCLEDGVRVKYLGRYLKDHHRMDPGEYLAKWKLPQDYPFTAGKLAALIGRQKGAAARDERAA